MFVLLMFKEQDFQLPLQYVYCVLKEKQSSYNAAYKFGRP